MRKFLLASLCLIVVGITVFVGAQPNRGRAKVRIRLVDADTGKNVAGVVRVSDADSKHVDLPGLFDRMTGILGSSRGKQWYVLPSEGAETMLPRAKLQIESFSGLESALARQDIDLSRNAPDELTIKLSFLFRPADLGLAAGNTHLHLRGFSLDTADEYLRKIPAADGLRIMFISYLERDKDDLTYITNKYPIGDQPKLSTAGVLVNNGEEHRHNFAAYNQGYGHVMFLNIKELVKPVSIGPGITGTGFDDLPLAPGMDNARKQGGTVLWCHNTNGYEHIVNVLAGRLDALNVFDGSRTGKYEENYYKYLNIGLRIPISTGTDWFMYDLSRVYAEVRGQVTIPAWLDAVKAGRCQATNGPLLTLQVDGRSMGDVIDLQDAKTIKIQASALGRNPLQRLQLIQNGQVIKTQVAGAREPGSIKLTHEVRVDGPAWFAVRIDGGTPNEFGTTPFAHSSPVYVTHKGKGVFDVDAALGLLKQVEEGQAAIKGHGKFSSPEASAKMLALYDDTTKNLRARINARK